MEGVQKADVGAAGKFIEGPGCNIWLWREV